MQFPVFNQKYNDLRLRCRCEKKDLQRHNQVNLARSESTATKAALSSRVVFIMFMPARRGSLKHKLGAKGFHILLVAGHAGAQQV